MKTHNVFLSGLIVSGDNFSAGLTVLNFVLVLSDSIIPFFFGAFCSLTCFGG